MKDYRVTFQTLWGLALLMMGIGVFFRIPHVMERVGTIEHFVPATLFIRICFYIMGLLLIGGGIQKLYGLWYSDSRVHHSGDE